MEIKSVVVRRGLAGAVFLLLLGLIAVSHDLRSKQAAIPKHIVEPRSAPSEPFVTSTNSQQQIFGYDTVLFLGEKEFRYGRELAHELETFRPGDSVEYRKSWAGNRYEFSQVVALLPLYSRDHLLIRSSWLLIHLLLLASIYSRRRIRLGSHLLLMTMFAAFLSHVALGLPHNEALDELWLLRVMGIISLCIYMATTVHVSLGYPRKKEYRSKIVLGALYGFAILLAAVGCFAFSRAVTGNGIGAGYYQEVNSLTMFALGGSYLFGFCGLVHTYVTSREAADRRAALWIILGAAIFMVGTYTFGASTLFGQYVQIAVPFAAAISLCPYRGLKLESFYRGLFTFAIVSILVAIGSAIVMGAMMIMFQPYFKSDSEWTYYAVLSAISLVLLYIAGRSVRQILSNRYYRMRSFYREALDELEQNMRSLTTFSELSVAALRSLNSVIDSRYHRVVLNGEVLPADPANSGFSDSTTYPAYLRDAIESRGIIVLRNAAEDKTLHTRSPMLDESDEEVFVRLETRQLRALGFLALGRKTSGYKYSSEDIDFLKHAARSIGLAIEQMILSNDLAKRAAETKALRELSEFKSQIVSAISHDLKTPITSIKMYSQLLRRSLQNGRPMDHLDEFLSIMEGESKRLTAMIDNALDHRRIEQGVMNYKRTLVDLNEVVIDVMNSFKYLFQLQGVTVKCVYAMESLETLADPLAVQNILINLLTNAVKFSGSSRDIYIATGLTSTTVFVSIRDNGIGIPAHQLEQIFDPFFRVENSMEGLQARGAGLGLSNVRNMMEYHNGTVTVKSIEGQGSTFTINFPRSQQPARHIERKSESTEHV